MLTGWEALALDTKERKEIDLIKRIYSTLEQPESWTEVLSDISTHLESSHAFVAARPGVDAQPLYFVEHGFPEQHFERYEEHFYKVDVWTQSLARHRFNEFHASHDVCHDKVFLGSEIYADFAKPADIRNSIGCLVANPESELVTEIAFMNGREGGHYQESLIRSANRFVPHIQHSLSMAQRLATGINAGQDVYAALDPLPEASLVCAHDGELLYLNTHGQSLIESANLVSVRSGIRSKLEFRNPDVQQSFIKVCRELRFEALAEPRQCYAWSADHKRRFRIRFSPWMHKQMSPLGWQLRSAILINIQYSAQHLVISPELLREQFPLSRAESHICSLLCSGESLASISSTRGSSMNTLKQQMKSIFSKLQVCTQAELINLLLRQLTVI